MDDRVEVAPDSDGECYLFVEIAGVELVSVNKHLHRDVAEALRDQVANRLQAAEERVAMPLAEVCDRFTISRLKRERLPDENPERLEHKIRYYARGIDFDDEELAGMVERLKEINGRIWDAEAEIRAGQDEDLGLEEIGRRALRIRDLNRERVAVKNEISRYAGDGMEDVKVNHASETP